MAEPERRVVLGPRPDARRRAPPRPARRRHRHRPTADGARRSAASAATARRRGVPIPSSTSTSTSGISALPAPGSMRAAARHGHAHLPGPLRPDPAAVDDARHRRAGGRARRAWLWKIHHSVADGTGAARLSELFIQPTRDAPALPAVDLEAPSPPPSRPTRRAAAVLVESAVGTATHLARRQAGIARRVVGEVAMWGADPRAPSTPSGARREPSASSAIRSREAAAGRRHR